MLSHQIMNISTLSTFLRKILALIFVGYFSIFSPLIALAVTQPVSAPVSAPISVPIPAPSPTPSPSVRPSPTPTPIPIIPIATPSATITQQPQIVTSGNNITVSWNVSNASVNDFIRILSAVGDKNAGPFGISPSNNCNLNKIPGTRAIKTGSCSFTSAVIPDLGTFKLAYYHASGALLATSRNFSVTAASRGSLIARPSAVLTNSQVNLSWSAVNNAHHKDYINYLNTDNFTGTATSHSYWPSNHCAWSTNSTIPASSGSCTIETPYIPGRFKLVLMSGNVPVGQPAPILAVSNVITVSTSSAIPSPSVRPSPTPTPIPTPKIISITPASRKAGDIVTVTGSGFGNKTGLVIFYNQLGQAVSGTQILGWYDSQIKFRVPAVAANSNYQVEVRTIKSLKSNRISFRVELAQPVIYRISPAKLRVGNSITIVGQNLGSPGKINFYLPGSTSASGNATIYYWSSYLIYGQIPTTLQANKTYNIQVKTADDRDSSLVYRQIGR